MSIRSGEPFGVEVLAPGDLLERQVAGAHVLEIGPGQDRVRAVGTEAGHGATLGRPSAGMLRGRPKRRGNPSAASATRLGTLRGPGTGHRDPS